MLDTLTGFVVVGLAIGIGYLLGRIDLLGPHARPVLARLTFFVLTPFLLFVVLAEADTTMLFSSLLPASAIAAFAMIALYVLFARVLWRRGLGETVIGAVSAAQVNANNIGFPISLYLLGSAAYPAPVILFQLIVLTPFTLTLLDIATSDRKASIWKVLRRTVSNPIILGAAGGTLASVFGLSLPPIVWEPMSLIAGACIPVLLINYGLSLHGSRVLAAHGRRRDVLLASAIKLVVMPIAAWAIAALLFQLPPTEVLIIVVLAALPTAQNVFNYSERYNTGIVISRDTIFITTIGCVPVLLLVTLLLG